VTINFMPNDPSAKNSMPMRQQAARANRPAGRAGFNFDPHAAEKVYDFGTTDFLFWQCREAALAAVEAFEAIAGNLTSWANRSANPRNIDVSTVFDDGETLGAQRLNAYYDGQGVRFFDFKVGNEMIYSGNSTDTVSHEVGHALLDAMRPELFQSTLPEIPAFHEAFGDCMAILTALADRDARGALLQASADLSAPNFVEAGSEYLSGAIKKQFGNVAPSKPRRALNKFKWQLPTTLPAGTFEDPPELLSVEAHSFSRVFTGCFYDLLRSIFAATASKSEVDLAASAVTAGKLLVSAVGDTPATARYFQAIGRAMIKADELHNEGENRARIGAAFAGHGIMLGSAAMTAPTAGLAGPPPKVQKAVAKLAPATLADLRLRIRTKPGARFAVRPVRLLGEGVAEAVHQREISLASLDSRLKGVVSYAPEPILIGASGGRAALLGALPEPNRTEDEVQAYVASLLKHDRISFARGARRAVTAVSAAKKAPEIYTHAVRSIAGKKVLTRIRFLCGCCGYIAENRRRRR
jgi:hypothetical protein